MTMTLTTGAASLSRTMMRRGRHHDPPSSGGGRRGGGRSSLRCPASPVQRTSPCADSDRTSPRRHPRRLLLTRGANPRRLRRRRRIASGGRRCARMARTDLPWRGRRYPSRDAPSSRWGRDGGASPNDDVQRGEGNENKYFIPYFSQIRRRRRGRDYDGRRWRKGGGGRRWSAMDTPSPIFVGP